jgi:hypothetical protein
MYKRVGSRNIMRMRGIGEYMTNRRECCLY